MSYHIDAANGDYYPNTISQPLKKSNGSFGKTHKIKFLTQTRTDVTESYAQNAKVKEDRRIYEIQVLSGGTFLDSLVRKYKIIYHYSPSTQRSRITSIQECGSNGTTCLPAQAFTWEGGDQSLFSYTATNLYIWVGNTSPDVARHDMQSRIRYGDFNGDGRTDILRHEGPWGAYTRLTTHMSNGDGSFTHHWRKGPSLYIGDSLNNANLDLNRLLHLGDFNGDGKTDILYHGGYWGRASALSVYLSNGNGTFSGAAHGGPSIWIGSTHESINFELSRMKFGDFNGDGRTDIYIVRGWGTTASTGGLSDQVCLSNGNGSFRCTNTGPRFFVWSSVMGIDIRRVMVGDFNGDGASDLLRVNGWGGSSKSTVCLSNRNATFRCSANGPNFYIDGTEQSALFDLSRIRLGDFNGDGQDRPVQDHWLGHIWK